MTTLSAIILTCLAGGVLSVACAAFFALNARVSWIPMLISYAIGALLGAVFLEILPHAFEAASSVENMAATVLVGILVFFVLEKLVLWRHCHGDHCEVHAPDEHHGHSHAHAHGADHAHDHGRSGMMIMIGDTFHNFVDGILIAAAFMLDVKLGMVTALAIIAHEIPQEVGDFLILLHSGYSKKKALLFNLLSSLATLVGGLIAYFALQTVEAWIPTILGLAAASMIYVAVADLIPGLHKRTELKATLQQVLLIGLGVSSILLVKLLLE
ncbi:ZIP family metal transporter [Methylobacillus flagellatus]|uniref:ZIP family metal transporter n=1 Tax=Methylobacillus flagellatus TaxID=405 RepID=UPI0010F83D26|nr:ZIP family metal transporter [Methylobacillus flagellatus]